MVWLEKIIDDCLQKMSGNGYSMKTVGDPPAGMADSSILSEDDWRGWKPIKSPITDEDINKLEANIKHVLPESFRHFLKYKCFYRLHINDHNVNLFDILPDKKLSTLEDCILRCYVPELIIERNYIYIADFQDFGLLCFDANEARPDNEYPIVYLDHEDLEAAPFLYADNFRALLEADSDAGNRFIEKLNEYYRNL